MILELDVGNSRIKWRLVAAQTLTPIAQGHVPGFAELQDVPELDSAIEFARMCSVRDAQTNGEIESWMLARYGIKIAQARVTRSCGGVTNQYADVDRLGIDRWLAMLAAYNRASGACLVIDSGTAFTLDVVDERGLHLGGYIIPGLRLMHNSLEANTAIRLNEDYTDCARELGHSTDEAVFNGTVSALLGTIERIRQQLQDTSQPKIYFAGGDAQLLHRLAGIGGSEIVSSLVFEGLAVACPAPDLRLGRS